MFRKTPGRRCIYTIVGGRRRRRRRSKGSGETDHRRKESSAIQRSEGGVQWSRSKRNVNALCLLMLFAAAAGTGEEWACGRCCTGGLKFKDDADCHRSRVTITGNIVWSSTCLTRNTLHRHRPVSRDDGTERMQPSPRCLHASMTRRLSIGLRHALSRPGFFRRICAAHCPPAVCSLPPGSRRLRCHGRPLVLQQNRARLVLGHVVPASAHVPRWRALPQRRVVRSAVPRIAALAAPARR